MEGNSINDVNYLQTELQGVMFSTDSEADRRCSGELSRLLAENIQVKPVLIKTQELETPV
jgi:hypothetical protein